jgi:hypothetical protein
LHCFALEMEELKVEERDSGGDRERDEESGGLLADHGFGASDDEDEDGDGDEELDGGGGGRRSIRPNLWMVLSVLATLAGRRVLRGQFGESPF